MRKPAKPPSVSLVAEPPALHMLPLAHASAEVCRWFDHYWAKLNLPGSERDRLAITQDRREFARWTGRRLNPLALGCYCYFPGAQHPSRSQAALAPSIMEAPPSLPAGGQLSLPGMETAPPRKATNIARNRHLIFIEPDLLPLGREVTVAHELIHLADRVRGRPRRHTCHGYDAIAVDEAAITGYDPEDLRQLLRDETARREAVLRQSRPIRYLYQCPNCAKEYRRVRRYPRAVSCGVCDRSFNGAYLLVLKAELDASSLGNASDSFEDLEDLDDEITI